MSTGKVLPSSLWSTEEINWSWRRGYGILSYSISVRKGGDNSSSATGISSEEQTVEQVLTHGIWCPLQERNVKTELSSSKWNVLTTLLVLTKPWESSDYLKHLYRLLSGIYSSPDFHGLSLILVAKGHFCPPVCYGLNCTTPGHSNLPYLRIWLCWKSVCQDAIKAKWGHMGEHNPQQLESL